MWNAIRLRFLAFASGFVCVFLNGYSPRWGKPQYSEPEPFVIPSIEEITALGPEGLAKAFEDRRARREQVFAKEMRDLDTYFFWGMAGIFFAPVLPLLACATYIYSQTH